MAHPSLFSPQRRRIPPSNWAWSTLFVFSGGKGTLALVFLTNWRYVWSNQDRNMHCGYVLRLNLSIFTDGCSSWRDWGRFSVPCNGPMFRVQRWISFSQTTSPGLSFASWVTTCFTKIWFIDLAHLLSKDCITCVSHWQPSSTTWITGAQIQILIPSSKSVWIGRLGVSWTLTANLAVNQGHWLTVALTISHCPFLSYVTYPENEIIALVFFFSFFVSSSPISPWVRPESRTGYYITSMMQLGFIATCLALLSTSTIPSEQLLSAFL